MCAARVVGKASNTMWDEPNQTPPGQNPARQLGRQDAYPPFQNNGAGYGGGQAGQGGGFGNAPTERVQGGGYGQYGPNGPNQPPDYGPYAPGGAPDYGPPPPFEPQQPHYPGGRQPQWPGPGYDRPQQPSPYPPQQPPAPPRRYTPEPQYPQYPQQRSAQPPRYNSYDERRERHDERKPRSLPHLPIAHVLLILGIVAMAYAISQPWGTDASGSQVFIHDFGSTRLSGAGVDAGALAVRAATGIVIAAAVLSAALILLNTVVTILNKALGIVGLSGCASLAFFPVLWGGATLLTLVLLAAAGFAGLGLLSHLPTVESHGFAVVSVQNHAIGYYLWCGGIVAVFVGMLGQLMLRRR